MSSLGTLASEIRNYLLTNIRSIKIHFDKILPWKKLGKNCHMPMFEDLSVS